MISSIKTQQSNQIGQELYQLISELWLEIAIQEIVGLIPAEKRFILVDDNQRDFKMLPEVYAMPFLEQDG